MPPKEAQLYEGLTGIDVWGFGEGKKNNQDIIQALKSYRGASRWPAVSGRTDGVAR